MENLKDRLADLEERNKLVETKERLEEISKKKEEEESLQKIKKISEKIKTFFESDEGKFLLQIIARKELTGHYAEVSASFDHHKKVEWGKNGRPVNTNDNFILDFCLSLSCIKDISFFLDINCEEENSYFTFGNISYRPDLFKSFDLFYNYEDKDGRIKSYHNNSRENAPCHFYVKDVIGNDLVLRLFTEQMIKSSPHKEANKIIDHFILCLKNTIDNLLKKAIIIANNKLVNS